MRSTSDWPAQPRKATFSSVFQRREAGLKTGINVPDVQGDWHMDPVQLPRQIDEPPTVLLWNTDELAPIVLLHVIGIFTGNVLIMTALGFAASSLYKRFRDGHPDGYLQHLLYWIGLMPTSARTIRNPFADHYKP